MRQNNRATAELLRYAAQRLTKLLVRKSGAADFHVHEIGRHTGCDQAIVRLVQGDAAPVLLLAYPSINIAFKRAVKLQLTIRILGAAMFAQKWRHLRQSVVEVHREMAAARDQGGHVINHTIHHRTIFHGNENTLIASHRSTSSTNPVCYLFELHSALTIPERKPLPSIAPLA
ncbi:hypothetical protein NB231_07807 [Nitrococcus mobilis Nb-231]|uniref:Uncharacterized protein n=1 Tax=Nitrococcus mobilis Nb-231 TaxID=314278 RepID=A4BTF6_9GAMM|nr:hypothetical protein NB231_07807 [Nitrococcus mobilis Nb-231]